MANAGRVAIVPKGDYSSSTAYKRLDLVRYNDKAYVAKKSNTGIVPTNTEYWMLMTSDGIVIDSALSDSSTNAVQNKVLKSALDSIQTTSRATLSQAGWHRVAEYAKETDGYPVNTCELIIKKAYNTQGCDFHHLRFVITPFNACQIDCLGSKVVHTQGITKARHVIDSVNNKCYLEIYYAFDTLNWIMVNVENGNSVEKCWKAITPTLTSEEVDGVTVTTTYDIPANAKPVNDIDLTTALAGYLPKTGGAVDGNVTIKADDATERVLYLENGKRKIIFGVNANGEFYIYDSTNSKYIFRGIVDGTNTFNGTATGNLPLDALSFSATAPTNTKALWVDTTNKVIKAYIDGAWTVIA